MICNNCQKLSFMVQDKSCVNCSKPTGSKLKVLCDSCSDHKGQCQVCLKKTTIQQPTKISSSCNACGGK